MHAAIPGEVSALPASAQSYAVRRAEALWRAMLACLLLVLVDAQLATSAAVGADCLAMTMWAQVADVGLALGRTEVFVMRAIITCITIFTLGLQDIMHTDLQL